MQYDFLHKTTNLCKEMRYIHKINALDILIQSIERAQSMR